MHTHIRYLSLRQLLEYRGHVILDPELNQDQLTKNLKKDRNVNYIIINAEPGPRIKGFRRNGITAVLVTNKPNMSDIVKLRDALRKNKRDILFVLDINVEAVKSGEKVETWFEEIISYINVCENKGANVQCFPHRVVSPAERAALNFHGSINPLIQAIDMMNIWAGGRHGELIEIKKISELAERPLDYRLVN
jgi:DNA-directed RNA polymerase subunit H (RpoH/RPB5)